MRYIKVDERYAPVHEYEFTSIPCPQCKKTATATIPAPRLFQINQGTTTLAAEIGVDEAERFISGICPSCWTQIFGDETHCEEETA